MNELYVKAQIYFETDWFRRDKAIEELLEELEGTGIKISIIESELRVENDEI